MKRSIKFQIMARIVVVVLVIIISFAWFLYNQFTSINMNNLSKRGSEEAQRNLIQLQSAIEDVYRLSEYLVLSEEVSGFLKNLDRFTPAEKAVAAGKLMDNLDRLLVSGKYIHSFCVVAENGESFWNTSPYDDFFQEWFIKNTDQSIPSKELGFTKAYDFPATSLYHRRHTLVSYVSNIYQIEDGKSTVRGQIIIQMNLQGLLDDIFANNSLFNGIAIFDEGNKILYGIGEDINRLSDLAVQLRGGIESLDGNYYVTSILEDCEWKVISSIDQNEFAKTADIPYAIAVSAVIFLALILLFVFLFPLLIKISKQITRLDGAIKEMSGGNLDATVELHGVQELENISNGFNIMVSNTKKYMDTSIESLKEQQKLQFELLLAKINPHFIYNTLNSVIYLARQKKSEDIISLTSAFIHLLQDSIHLGKNRLFEEIANEIEVVNQYIIIQNYRYMGRFSFSCRWDESLAGTYIPKNILQPIIENSILHGICPKADPGNICLEINRREENVEIIIADDGVGMDHERLESLFNFKKDETVKTPKLRHIGLNNVAQRLEFIFPGKHQFRIESQPGLGTKIVIIHPVVTTPDYPNSKGVERN